MADFVCPTCSRNAKTPENCCGQPMAQRGSFYCNKCNSRSGSAKNCCGSPMKML